MASGFPCATIGPFMPTDVDAATEDRILDVTNVPGTSVRVLDFDATNDEYMDFMLTWENYGGSAGITIKGRCSWSSDTNTAHKSRIEADLRVITTTTAINSAFTWTYTSQGQSISVAGTVQHQTEFSFNIAHESGMTNGGVAILRIRRDPAHADDDASGDMELWVDSLRVVEQ